MKIKLNESIGANIIRYHFKDDNEDLEMKFKSEQEAREEVENIVNNSDDIIIDEIILSGEKTQVEDIL